MLRLATHRPDQHEPEFSFFILNKGMNSGKPLTEPCTNCFTASCSNENEKEFYYWLCWGLWQAKQFEHFLTGSVIPFIRKSELLQEIRKQAAHINHETYTATISKVQLMARQEETIKQQLQLLNQLKRAMIRQHLHK